LLCLQGDSDVPLIRDQEAGGSNPLAPTISYAIQQTGRRRRPITLGSDMPSLNGLQGLDIGSFKEPCQLPQRSRLGETSGSLIAPRLIAHPYVGKVCTWTAIAIAIETQSLTCPFAAPKRQPTCR